MEVSPVPPGVTIIRQLTDTVVRCKGRITSDTTQSLRATVKPLFSEGKRVVLDLTEAEYVDSSGLGTIIALCVSAKRAHCEFKVVYSHEHLKKLFRLQDWNNCSGKNRNSSSLQFPDTERAN